MKQLRLRGSWITHCIFLIAFLVTGANSSSAMLTQIPGSTIQLVTKAIEISCTVKGESMERLSLYWYRKTEKNGDLEFIISASQMGKFTYGTSVLTEKFTMKRTPLHGYFTLKIANLDHSDNGVYYCMAGISPHQYTFGDGTKITVVDSLPTTVQPTTKKPPCKCKKQKNSKASPPGVRCGALIWAPLAGFALMLLIGLYLLASHTYRVYRRTYMYFRKHSPK